MKLFRLPLFVVLTSLFVVSCGVPKEEVEAKEKAHKKEQKKLKDQIKLFNNKMKQKDSVIDSLSLMTQQFKDKAQILEEKIAKAEEEKQAVMKQFVEDKTGKYYKIQVAAVRKNKRTTKFFGEYKFTEANGNFYKFMYGHFKNIKEAYRVLRVIKGANRGADGKQYSGVTVNAFIVPYIDGERLMDIKTRG